MIKIVHVQMMQCDKDSFYHNEITQCFIENIIEVQKPLGCPLMLKVDSIMQIRFHQYDI